MMSCGAWCGAWQAPRRQPEQPGRVRRVGHVVGQEADRLVDEVGGEVIALGVARRRLDRRVVAHQLGRVLVGLGVHEAVVAVEAAAQRPAVERPGRRRSRSAASRATCRPCSCGSRAAAASRQGAGLPGDLAAIARIAAVEVGEAADADRVVIAPRQQGRARRRAHGRGVEAGVAQALAPPAGRWSASRSASRSSRSPRSRRRRTARRGCSARPSAPSGFGGHQGVESARVRPIFAPVMACPSSTPRPVFESPGFLQA